MSFNIINSNYKQQDEIVQPKPKKSQVDAAGVLKSIDIQKHLINSNSNIIKLDYIKEYSTEKYLQKQTEITKKKKGEDSDNDQENRLSRTQSLLKFMNPKKN